ncbi:MAG TPA: tyrosine-type recombinase/integrase [Dermatophilaceae bacterium]|nr:tyrosine-type recombinase/integrase [Dermatophilaceae bacterium]
MGEPLLDEYLRFTAARVRPNTLAAQAFDLKVFFGIVGKAPQQVMVTDVLGFIEAQRAPRRGGNVVRLADGESGLAASKIKRRLATVSSLFEYLFLRGICDRNPVPRSLGARHARPAGSGRGGRRGAPLVRAPRKLPRVTTPVEVAALTGALRTDRDRAMVALMVHGGLRRCEVLGLRFEHVQVGDRRVFVADGKGGHQRLVPVADVFFTMLASYLTRERPKESVDDHVFVVLKGPHRGRPLTAAGLDEVLVGARGGPGWRMRRVTSCGTPASRGFGRPGWRSRRSRPRPGMPRSKRPGSICTCPTTGWPGSTRRRWPFSMAGTRRNGEYRRPRR